MSLLKLNPIVQSEHHGYHFADIPKGDYGTISKIQEELLELQDAMDQGNKIMALTELSDLYGAIEGFIERNSLGVTMRDLEIMSHATKRAFESGHRK